MKARTYNIWDSIRLPFASAPVETVISLVLQLLAGVLPTLQIMVTAMFLDTAIAAVQGGDSKAVYGPLLGVVLLIAYSWVSGLLRRLTMEKLQIKLRENLRTSMMEKRAKQAYAHVENPDTWDLITRVAREPEVRIRQAFDSLLELAVLCMRVAGVLVLLWSHVWWAALIILVMSVPLVLLALKSGKATYDAERVTEKYRRKYDYLSEVLAGRETVEERTLFGFSQKLNGLFHKQFQTARSIKLRTEAKWFVRMKAGGVAFVIISLIISATLLQPVLTQTITLGLFISLVNAVFGMVQMMSWMLSYHVDQLAKNREFFKDVTAFAALDETPGATDPAADAPVFESLELKDVRFAYPGTDRPILDGLSLRIDAGRHYAFVGINGAGKTTITKLLTGLYDNYEGEILLNGKSLRDYPAGVLKATFSVVFQDFARYFVTLKQNITLGASGEQPARDAALLLGLDDAIAHLPHGWDTPLGKIKDDGQDLSGGEWQRVALARAVARPAPMRILDEPTAALDPVSESRVYEEFEKISRGATTLFISHRLGSTRLADEIYVIANGRVTERGNHETLMTAAGDYAAMYESQRSWYQ